MLNERIDPVTLGHSVRNYVKKYLNFTMSNKSTNLNRLTCKICISKSDHFLH